MGEPMRTHLKILAGTRTGGSGSAGFTLIEIMLAMGILAIGLVMVGAAFPTAIQQSKETAEDTAATLIFNNAVAICRDKLHANDFPAGPTWADFVYVAGPPTVAPVSMPVPIAGSPVSVHVTETAYPVDPVAGEDPNNIPRYRWIAIGRRINAPNPANPAEPFDVQLVIVPYRTYGKPLADMPTVLQVYQFTCTLSGTTMTFPPSPGSNVDKLHVGSPVVVMKTTPVAPATGPVPYENAGKFAYITTLDPNKNDSNAVALSNTLAGDKNTYDVLVFGSPDLPLVPPNNASANRGGRSPALGAYVARVTLKP